MTATLMMSYGVVLPQVNPLGVATTRTTKAGRNAAGRRSRTVVVTRTATAMTISAVSTSFTSGSIPGR
jgi:hypothetical protein